MSNYQDPQGFYEDYLRKRRYNLVDPWIEDEDIIYDFGAGTGSVWTHSRKDITVYGSDMEPFNSPMYISINDMNEVIQYANHVTLFGVMEHMNYYSQDSVANDMHDIGNGFKDLRTITFTTPNANSIHRIFAEKMGNMPSRDSLTTQDINIGHHRVYAIGALRVDCDRFVKAMLGEDIFKTFSQSAFSYGFKPYDSTTMSSLHRSYAELEALEPFIGHYNGAEIYVQYKRG